MTIIEFLVALPDRNEIFQHGGLLRFAQTGKIHLDDYHITNDMHRVQALADAGFLTYEIEPDYYGSGQDAMNLRPTGLTQAAIRLYEQTNIDELLAKKPYMHDASYGSM
jgi:hypothetical protein